MTEEIDLLQLVIDIDNELIQEGREPFQRPIHTNLEIGKRLRLGNRAFLDDPIAIEVNRIYKNLYRPNDLYMPPMHIGAFMFRDVFFPLRIPVGYGSFMIDLVEYLDAPDKQKQWLFSNHKSGLTYLDQAIDLIDFTYGFDDIQKEGQLPNKTIEWWYMAKQQLEAAAATVLGSFDKHAVIQNCCISTELLLKGALMATVEEITEKILKDEKQGYGHNLENLVRKTAQQLPSLDEETMLFAVKQFPNYVKSRYEAQNFSRLELGNFLMNAQFIGGEIIRQFSERNFRAGVEVTPGENWNLAQRTFPKAD